MKKVIYMVGVVIVVVVVAFFVSRSLEKEPTEIVTAEKEVYVVASDISWPPFEWKDEAGNTYISSRWTQWVQSYAFTTPSQWAQWIRKHIEKLEGRYAPGCSEIEQKKMNRLP